MRPVRAEVDLSAIAWNVHQLGAVSRAPMMAVVKADAYGHGAVPVARTCLAAGAQWLGVAVAEEARELVAAGIQAPILVLGYCPPEAMPELVRAGVRLTVFNGDGVRAAARAAAVSGRAALVHAKLDTGMRRLGFRADRGGLAEVAEASSQPGLVLEGLFTHLATADEEDKEFARRQVSLFTGFDRQLREKGIQIPLRHAANSAAVLSLPDAHLDLVRPGIALYGYFPSRKTRREDVPLRPAMRLVAPLVLVKEVAGGEGVSYNRTYVAPSPRQVATVPLGYADGYPRLLSNRGEALVRGQRVPVVGRVCMDQLMLDVTGLRGVQEGEEAVLFGRQGEGMLLADELAERIGTISYELLTGIGPRVPRFYLPETV